MSAVNTESVTFVDYYNPLSTKFTCLTDFKDLELKHKILTVALTVLAALLLSSVPVFRLLVNKYHKKIETKTDAGTAVSVKPPETPKVQEIAKKDPDQKKKIVGIFYEIYPIIENGNEFLSEPQEYPSAFKEYLEKKFPNVTFEEAKVTLSDIKAKPNLKITDYPINIKDRPTIYDLSIFCVSKAGRVWFMLTDTRTMEICADLSKRVIMANARFLKINKQHGNIAIKNCAPWAHELNFSFFGKEIYLNEQPELESMATLEKEISTFLQA